MRMDLPNLIFYGDVQLEIDDEGKPHYIRSYGDFITARNGFDVKGIVMVDPATGDCGNNIRYRMYLRLSTEQFPLKQSVFRTAISESMSMDSGIRYSGKKM